MSGAEAARPRELQVGGAVDSVDQPYVLREADQELLDLLQAGEFVNVVTSRQMGKTSLVYRAEAQLAPLGFLFAYFDLARLRSETDPRRYFQTLVGELARELGVTIDVDAFWAQRNAQTVSQGFIDFFREILERTQARVIIVLDEIDSTLERDFTDDLFTAIRSIYFARPREAPFKRLTFCLVGVATPNELIKTRRTTPYNIGRTIWLRDFDPKHDKLAPMASTLNADASIANPLLARVLYWSGGQPYLTAWMCDELRREGACEPQAVDALVDGSLSSLDKLRSDPHFEQTQRFISERVTNGAEVLGLYERILCGEREADQAANLTYAHLKLSGLVKRDDMGNLVTRNRIYERLFNLEWVQKSKPKQELRKARRFGYATAAALVAALIGGGIYYQTSVAPLQQQADASQELEKLQVTLTADGGGWTNVGLPVQGRNDVLKRALPYLMALGSGPNARALALDLSGTQGIDLELIASLTPLTGLDISGTPVADLAPLVKLVKLKRLSVAMTAVTDIAPLSSLRRLEALDVSFTKVTNLEPVGTLERLQQLDVSSTAVSDIAVLGRLISLRELNLSRTRIKKEGLGAIQLLSNLRTLALDGTGIVDFNRDDRMRGLKVLQDPLQRQSQAAYQEGDTFRDCAECPQMVVVPAGSFLMGSPLDEAGRAKNEGPQQQIRIARAFAVGRFEVRFDEWMHCVADNVCKVVSDEGWGRGARPVIKNLYAFTP